MWLLFVNTMDANFNLLKIYLVLSVPKDIYNM